MKVAYQGCPGAYSEMAVRAACPDGEPTPCEQFEVCPNPGHTCTEVPCPALKRYVISMRGFSKAMLPDCHSSSDDAACAMTEWGQLW